MTDVTINNEQSRFELLFIKDPLFQRGKSDGCCPTHGGEAGERSETEGADCVAIGDWGIFEKFIKQYKVKSEDL